jgi:hypothetical protein
MNLVDVNQFNTFISRISVSFYNSNLENLEMRIGDDFSKIFGGPEKGRLCEIAEKRSLSLGGLVGLLGQENGLDVGQDTTLSNGDTREKFVQLFVVADGKLQVTRDDAGLLVVTGSVTGQLENLSGQVLHDGSQVDGSTGTNTFSVRALAEHSVDTTNGKLKSGSAGTCL